MNTELITSVRQQGRSEHASLLHQFRSRQLKRTDSDERCSATLLRQGLDLQRRTYFYGCHVRVSNQNREQPDSGSTQLLQYFPIGISDGHIDVFTIRDQQDCITDLIRLEFVQSHTYTRG